MTCITITKTLFAFSGAFGPTVGLHRFADPASIANDDRCNRHHDKHHDNHGFAAIMDGLDRQEAQNDTLIDKKESHSS